MTISLEKTNKSTKNKVMKKTELNNNFRCGMVSIIGRPNVGKSTLLNAVVGEKIAIVSKVPQTTRNKIRGIYNDNKTQIIFIDTPGFHQQRDKLDAFMNASCLESAHDVDCVIHLVDANIHVGKEEERIISKLSGLKIPVILGFNKIDLKGKCIPEYISLWEKIKGVPVNEMDSLVLLPLSGKTGLNIDLLLNLIRERLPEGPALYPQDSVTDIPQKIAIADIVREKLFNILRNELPHAIAVIVDRIKTRKKVYYIWVNILVEKESQKEIVIGRKGQVLKKVGTLAREELEQLVETKVFLELYVKTKKKWRDNVSLLGEMGYNTFNQ